MMTPLNTAVTQDDLAWLVSDAAQQLLTQWAGTPENPAMVTRLRKREGLSEVRCALLLEQLRTRGRAAVKYPTPWAERLLATSVGLEQSTDAWIAAYKATRFPVGACVADLCCGIGGDAMALANRCRVTGVDSDPLTAQCARWNLSIATSDVNDALPDVPDVLSDVTASDGSYPSQIVEADVTTFPLADFDAIHLDPDRRATVGRTTFLEAYQPPKSVIDRMIADMRQTRSLRCSQNLQNLSDLQCSSVAGSMGVAIKLAPGSTAPSDWATCAELEWISRDRECRQQMVWMDGLTTIPGQRRATAIFPLREFAMDHASVDSVCEAMYDGILCNGAVRYRVKTIHGNPEELSAMRALSRSTTLPKRWIIEPDVSVLAAGLTGVVAERLDAESLTSDGAYLTTSNLDTVTAAALPVRCFEWLETLPNDARKLLASLNRSGIGRLEYKVRNLPIDPRSKRRPADPVTAIFGKRPKLTGSVDKTAVLFVLGTSDGERLTFLGRRLNLEQ